LAQPDQGRPEEVLQRPLRFHTSSVVSSGSPDGCRAAGLRHMPTSISRTSKVWFDFENGHRRGDCGRLGGSPPARSALQLAVPIAARRAGRAPDLGCGCPIELHPARPATSSYGDSRRAGRVGSGRDRVGRRASGAGRNRGGPDAPQCAIAALPRSMIPVPSGSGVWLATGHTDMHKGFDGLAALVQDHLARDPF
jgi:hypothetical protein